MVLDRRYGSAVSCRRTYYREVLEFAVLFDHNASATLTANPSNQLSLFCCRCCLSEGYGSSASFAF